MRVALKIDVTSSAGFDNGLPALLDLLGEYDLRGSFFISPDLLTRDWLVNRNRVRQQRDILQRAMASDHDLGLAPMGNNAWSIKAAHADLNWTRSRVQESFSRFEQLTGSRPVACAAPGWQINPHLLAVEDELGFKFASDTRGRFPYFPQLLGVDGNCPQIPTTLPTMNEMLGSVGVDIDNVHEYLYAESCHLLPAGHVYSASADIEGMDYLSVMEKLLVMWRGQEGSVGALSELLGRLDVKQLPRHQVGWQSPPGVEQHQATQSIEVPGIG